MMKRGKAMSRRNYMHMDFSKVASLSVGLNLAVELERFADAKESHIP